MDDLTARLPLQIGGLEIEELEGRQGVSFGVRVGDRIHIALLNYDEMLELVPALFSWIAERGRE